jgi:hypothetical protein
MAPITATDAIILAATADITVAITTDLFMVYAIFI